MMVEELERRITALERERFHCPTHVSMIDESMRRVRNDVENKGVYSATWKFVPTDYYDWSLYDRASYLGASTTDSLCKSLLFENKKRKTIASSTSTTSDKKDVEECGFDPTNPKYILVVLQYNAVMDTKRLMNCIRSLRPAGKNRLPENMFDLRLATAEDNERITGFQHNAVSPFGIIHKDEIITIVSESIVSSSSNNNNNHKEMKFIWMGGGHVHLKLGMAVSEFITALKPIIGNVSEPRNMLKESYMMTGIDAQEQDVGLLGIMERRRQLTNENKSAMSFDPANISKEHAAALPADLIAKMEQKRKQADDNQISPEATAALQKFDKKYKDQLPQTPALSSDLQAIMERRQKQGAVVIDPTSSYQKDNSNAAAAGGGGTSTAPISSDLQAIMERRRLAGENGGSGSDHDPFKEKIKQQQQAPSTTSLSSDLQAKMERRRMVDEGVIAATVTDSTLQANKSKDISTGPVLNSEVRAVMERRLNSTTEGSGSNIDPILNKSPVSSGPILVDDEVKAKLEQRRQAGEQQELGSNGSSSHHHRNDPFQDKAKKIDTAPVLSSDVQAALQKARSRKGADIVDLESTDKKKKDAETHKHFDIDPTVQAALDKARNRRGDVTAALAEEAATSPRNNELKKHVEIDPTVQAALDKARERQSSGRNMAIIMDQLEQPNLLDHNRHEDMKHVEIDPDVQAALNKARQREESGHGETLELDEYIKEQQRQRREKGSSKTGDDIDNKTNDSEQKDAASPQLRVDVGDDFEAVVVTDTRSSEAVAADDDDDDGATAGNDGISLLKGAATATGTTEQRNNGGGNHDDDRVEQPESLEVTTTPSGGIEVTTVDVASREDSEDILPYAKDDDDDNERTADAVVVMTPPSTTTTTTETSA